LRHPTRALSCLLTLAVAVLPVWSQSSEEQVRTAANAFGAALTTGTPSLLKRHLPTRGKVQLRLARLGSQSGFYSASQVEAVLRDFLRQGSVRGFELLHVEYDPQGYALVRCSAVLVDRNGRAGSIQLYLAIQPEGERWVLREIRESPS